MTGVGAEEACVGVHVDELAGSAALASPRASARATGEESRPDADRERTAAVFCVGNRLMLDEGVGPAVYDELRAHYESPDNVQLFDVGCMSLDMLGYVDACDLVLTVDAVDGTGDAPGTVYRFEPDAMARHSGPEASLHDLKLVDLFDARVATDPDAAAVAEVLARGEVADAQRVALVALDVDAEAAEAALLDVGGHLGGGGDVADVADRGLHDEVGTEVAGDRLGLGGRLDDEEVLGHVGSGGAVPGREGCARGRDVA